MKIIKNYSGTIRAIGILATLILLSGCTTQNIASGTGTVCDGLAPDAINIYGNITFSPFSGDFEQVFTYSQQNNNEREVAAKNLAFDILVDQVKFWSRANTIERNGIYIRATVVFISPDVARGVFLNELLYGPTTAKDDGFDYPSSAREALRNIIDRNEYFFLVIYTASKECADAYHADCKIQPSVKGLTIVDAGNYEAIPQHDDHILEMDNTLGKDGVGGIVTYAMSAPSGQTCRWVLDPRYNNEITMIMPNFNLNDKKIHPTFNFVFPFQSILNIPYKHTILDFNSLDRNAELYPIIKPPENFSSYYKDMGKKYPPAPTKLNVDDEADSYFRAMARYVWYELVKGAISGIIPSTSSDSSVTLPDN